MNHQLRAPASGGLAAHSGGRPPGAGPDEIFGAIGDAAEAIGGAAADVGEFALDKVTDVAAPAAAAGGFAVGGPAGAAVGGKIGQAIPDFEPGSDDIPPRPGVRQPKAAGRQGLPAGERVRRRQAPVDVTGDGRRTATDTRSEGTGASDSGDGGLGLSSDVLIPVGVGLAVVLLSQNL